LEDEFSEVRYRRIQISLIWVIRSSPLGVYAAIVTRGRRGVIKPRLGEKSGMRRLVFLLAAMTIALLQASGVALAVNKTGTDGPDTLRGTNGDDKLVGKGGNDRLFSLAGDDTPLGGPGKDVVFGDNERLEISGGDKNFLGGPGNDFVNGGKGSDNVVGGKGNDLLGDGALRESSEDNLSGGDGKDVILVDNKPASKDLVVCGDGFDRVLTDRADVIAPDCETLVVVHGSFEDIIRQENRFFESVPESFFEGLPPIFV
jgi:Ca2+-binding RTX toxin-like protein